MSEIQKIETPATVTETLVSAFYGAVTVTLAALVARAKAMKATTVAWAYLYGAPGFFSTQPYAFRVLFLSTPTGDGREGFGVGVAGLVTLDGPDGKGEASRRLDGAARWILRDTATTSGTRHAVATVKDARQNVDLTGATVTVNVGADGTRSMEIERQGVRNGPYLLSAVVKADGTVL